MSREADMNFNLRSKILALFTFAFLSGCLNQAEVNFPDVGIEQNKLNHELEIILLPSNTYIIDEPIELVVRLRSNVEVYTNYNFGVRMFMLDETSNQWEEVYDPVISHPEGSGFELNFLQNGFHIGSDNVILSLKDKSKLNQLGLNLHPTIKNENKYINLLIVVSGYIYENEIITEQKVGAYTIVKLKQ